MHKQNGIKTQRKWWSSVMSILKPLKILKRFLCSKTILYISLNFLMLLLCSVIAPIVSYLYKVLIDTLNSSFNYVTIALIIGAYILSQVIQELSENLQSYYSSKTDYLIKNNVLIGLSNKMSKIRLEELEVSSTYDFIDRVYKNIADNAKSVLESFINIFSPVITIVTYSILLYKIKWCMPIILLCSSIPYLLIQMRKSQKSYDQYVELNKSIRQLDYLTDIMTSRQYAKDIRIFRLNNYFNDKIDTIRKIVTKKELLLDAKYSTLDLCSGLIQNLALAVCLIITLYNSIYANGQVGDVVFVFASIQAIVSGINSVFSTISSAKQTTLYLNDWSKLDNLPNETRLEQVEVDNFNIELKNVNFKYPSSTINVIQNLDLKISAGQKIAIVGENGSGKSTLINLILGNYDATSGEVLFGGKPIKSVIDTLRLFVVPVLQNFNKYQFSVDDNIRAGNLGHDYDLASLQLLEFDDFITKLPKGVDTELGQLNEVGYELSGGEWQRLALLRALARKESKVLILDEPTASLDPLIEDYLYEKFAEIASDKTLILISHRLSAVKLCDSIVVMDNGRIVEQGPHDMLMQKKGKYYELYKSQQSFYTY